MNKLTALWNKKHIAAAALAGAVAAVWHEALVPVTIVYILALVNGLFD